MNYEGRKNIPSDNYVIQQILFFIIFEFICAQDCIIVSLNKTNDMHTLIKSDIKGCVYIISKKSHTHTHTHRHTLCKVK